MLKHRGFPSRLPSSDFQFTIRRPNKAGATKLIVRERYADRRNADRRADEGFMRALWEYFGEEAFERGNLDAGRLSWLLGREVELVGDSPNLEDYETQLKINVGRAMVSFPEVFGGH
jgi:hypothetical protein